MNNLYLLIVNAIWLRQNELHGEHLNAGSETTLHRAEEEKHKNSARKKNTQMKNQFIITFYGFCKLLTVNVKFHLNG